MIKAGIEFKLLLIVLALLVLASSNLFAESFTCKCVGVSDGDTITVLNGRTQVRIRLEGIDAPESHQDFGQKAKQLTSSLAFGKTVTINAVTTDRYGRTVARVIAGGKDVSLELVKAGLAWHYKKYSSDPVLAQAEQEARAAKKGLWSMPNPTPPWDYRHGGKGRK
jgi:endonuclease YncB( thermonuclease family)